MCKNKARKVAKVPDFAEWLQNHARSVAMYDNTNRAVIGVTYKQHTEAEKVVTLGRTTAVVPEVYVLLAGIIRPLSTSVMSSDSEDLDTFDLAQRYSDFCEDYANDQLSFKRFKKGMGARTNRQKMLLIGSYLEWLSSGNDVKPQSYHKLLFEQDQFLSKALRVKLLQGDITRVWQTLWSGTTDSGSSYRVEISFKGFPLQKVLLQCQHEQSDTWV
jgi:hypothetical protein